MLEGEISEIRLIDRLVELWREQFTGAIRFENEGIIKIIYFKGGDVLSASTNDRSDSIDEILMRAGKVSREHVKQALAKRKESETLGDALLNLGFITRKELTWARRVQVVGVIRSIDGWTTGSFTIVADYLPKRDEGTLFPLPQVLIELIVTDPDRPKFERLLDGGFAVYAKSADFDSTFPRLGLNEDADAIVTLVDGERMASEIATISGRDAFNVYRLLHALATLGLLVPARPAATAVDAAPVTPELAVPATSWDEPALEETTPAQAIYEFDEAEAARQPTIEVAIDRSAIPDYDTTAHSARRSAWDDEEELAEAPVAPARMPSWDAPSAAAAATASADALAAGPSTADADESAEAGWGFDDAQVEASRKGRTATAPRAPLQAPAKRSGRARGLIIATSVLLLLAAAAYVGYLYWPRAAEEPVAALEPRPRPRLKPQAPTEVPAATETASGPGTETIAPVADVAPTPTSTAPATTVPAASQPAVAAAPAASRTQVPASSAALPTVQPKAPTRTAGGKEAYDVMARDFAARAGTGFTVQIQILCEASNLENVVRAGGDQVWFVPQTIGTRSCYRVFWGRFPTREEAERGLASIPAALRDRNAAVKAVPGS
jgi:hypothetical protein